MTEFSLFDENGRPATILSKDQWISLLIGAVQMLLTLKDDKQLEAYCNWLLFEYYRQSNETQNSSDS